MVEPSQAQKIDTVVDDVFQKLKLPGVAVWVSDGGRVQQEVVRGFANVESQEAFSPQGRFPIGSLSKSFGAAATLILRDEGRLHLDQSPIDFIPGLGDFWRGVTIRHLLSMQSGLGEDFGGSWGERHLTLSNDEISKRLVLPVIPAAKPGTHYFYSNFGYMVLGRIISRAAGVDCRDFITQRLLEPLGMTETSWRVPSSDVVLGYRNEEDSFAPEDLLSSENDGAVFGGLWSSLPNMATWVNFLSSAHDEASSQFDAILSSESRREMQRGIVLRPVDPTSAAAPNGGYRSYGFGLVRFSSSREWTVGHGGAVPGFGCHMRWSPESGLGVFAVANLRYADLTDACTEILDVATFGASIRTTHLHPLVIQRAQQLLSLVDQWDPSVAREVFASNFFIDYPEQNIQKRFSIMKERGVGTGPKVEVLQLPGLSGKLRLVGVDLCSFTISTLEPGTAQDMEFLI